MKTELTQEQKRIKIAEACGWSDCHKSVASLVGFPTERKPIGIPPNRITYTELPYYFNDLNACHEMEKVLDDEMFKKWTDILFFIQSRAREEDGKRWQWLSSTATERAEAFGKTLGLW